MSLAITSASLDAALDALSQQAGQVPIGLAALRKAIRRQKPDIGDRWSAHVRAVLTHEIVARAPSGEKLAAYHLGSRVIAEEDA